MRYCLIRSLPRRRRHIFAKPFPGAKGTTMVSRIQYLSIDYFLSSQRLARDNSQHRGATPLFLKQFTQKCNNYRTLANCKYKKNNEGYVFRLRIYRRSSSTAHSQAEVYRHAANAQLLQRYARRCWEKIDQSRTG